MNASLLLLLLSSLPYSTYFARNFMLQDWDQVSLGSFLCTALEDCGFALLNFLTVLPYLSFENRPAPFPGQRL